MKSETLYLKTIINQLDFPNPMKYQKKINSKKIPHPRNAEDIKKKQTNKIRKKKTKSVKQ